MKTTNQPQQIRPILIIKIPLLEILDWIFDAHALIISRENL